MKPAPGFPSSVDCRWAQEHLHAHVEGESPPLVSRLLAGHLPTCPTCRAAVEALEAERLWVIDSMVESPRLSPRFPEKVLRRIQRSERSLARRRRRSALLRIAGVAALLGLAALVARPSWWKGPGQQEGPSVSPGPVATNVAVPPAPSRGLPSAREAAAASTIPDAHVPEASPPRARSLVQSVPLLEPIFVAHPEQGPSPPVESQGVPVPGQRGFGHVLMVANGLERARRDRNEAAEARAVESKDDPCHPDPNRDGRTDISDVAYSCQVLLAGEPPRPLQSEGNRPALDGMDCDEACYRA